MPEIPLSELKAYVEKCRADKASVSSYLIYGDEYLTGGAFDTLISLFVPEKKKLNHEPFDGADADMGNVLETLNTYSLIPGTKVVSLRDANVFYAKQDRKAFLKKAKTAIDAKDLKKAATYLVTFLSLAALGFDALQEEQRTSALTPDELSETGGAWIDTLVTYCRDNQIVIPDASDDGVMLEDAIKKGFPAKHIFIMTTDLVDKRRGLFKAFRDNGLVVNCAVPKGESKADRTVKQGLLRETAAARLSSSRKRIAPQAFERLCDLTGFDLRTFTGNIDKLIHYVGSRTDITVADVDKVLMRTRKDPVYELTGALSDRNIDMALFYLDSLLGDTEFFPLQILAAVINHMRKLLMAKDYSASRFGKMWRSGMTYPQFRDGVLPSVTAYDDWLSSTEKSWVAEGTEENESAAASANDLLVAKNPRNAYPIYQTLRKSDNFSHGELSGIFDVMIAADLKMKTGSLDPRLILEEVMIHICTARDR